MIEVFASLNASKKWLHIQEREREREFYFEAALNIERAKSTHSLTMCKQKDVAKLRYTWSKCCNLYVAKRNLINEGEDE